MRSSENGWYTVSNYPIILITLTEGFHFLPIHGCAVFHFPSNLFKPNDTPVQNGNIQFPLWHTTVVTSLIVALSLWVYVVGR